jgi:hypothetical protein
MLKVGSFEINASIDGDGHLTLWVQSADGSPVVPVDEDVAASDHEFAVRVTTKRIERRHADAGHDTEQAIA